MRQATERKITVGDTKYLGANPEFTRYRDASGLEHFMKDAKGVPFKRQTARRHERRRRIRV